ncbi:dephospho-CoA kinase [Tenacibaculum sp. nBUS_03]|uniref:dephospho-CoA kinase n=1 Tax=Tenacibaculum sp. nBUS_03 TaxID=3395320 RepID=UPI003EBB644C
MVIGLTGGIGSGKSTVAKLFSKFNNIIIYNADLEAKKLMNTSTEIKNKLIKEFSEEVYQNNQLNRPFLANIVFNNNKKLNELNSIVHPVVYKHLNDFIQKNTNKDIVYENAILFENKSNLFCDKIITVTAPTKTRIQRVIKRDNSTYKDVEKRINNQWKDSKKIMQSNYVINNLCISDTEKEISRIHNFLTNTKY